MSSEEEAALLWAYCASESQTLGEALAVLADSSAISRRYSIEAQANASLWSYHWAVLTGGGDADLIVDAAERMVALRDWLTSHVTELEQLRERLQLAVS